MITPELISYIRKERASLVTDDVIRANLKTQGWTEADVSEAYGIISGVVQSPVVAPTDPATKKYRKIKMWIIFAVLLVVFLFLFSSFFISLFSYQSSVSGILWSIVILVLGILASYFAAKMVSGTMDPPKTKSGEVFQTLGKILVGFVVTGVIIFGLIFVVCIVALSGGGWG